MPRGTTPKERKEKITKKEKSDNLLKEISIGSVGLAPNQLEAKLRRMLLKGKKKEDNNPGAAQSTKALEKESKKKKVKERLKEYAGGMLGTVPMVGGSNPRIRTKPKEFGAGRSEEQAVKEPLKKKKGGEVKKKSKKSGRLALRGYGKSR